MSFFAIMAAIRAASRRMLRTVASMILVLLALLSAGSFCYFGAACIWQARLREEYERYGIPHLRVPIGLLELLGATGVVIGLVVGPLGAAAALGLCVLMVSGVVVRIRLRDPLVRMLPAVSLAALNAALAYLFLSR